MFMIEREKSVLSNLVTERAHEVVFRWIDQHILSNEFNTPQSLHVKIVSFLFFPTVPSSSC